jgi:hypothetical protein
VEIIKDRGINLLKGERGIRSSNGFWRTLAMDIIVKNSFDADPGALEPNIVLRQEVKVFF